MKEAIIHAGPKVLLQDSPPPPSPLPNPNQLIIKVIVSGSNPKDWKVPEWIPETTMPALNQGDDICGIVHEVGSSVTEFRVGDRVAAFHQMLTPHGSYAEFAVSWESTTFHLPPQISFEEGATIPLAAMTAAIGLHVKLGVPEPWSCEARRWKEGGKKKEPLVVYGAASAVGAFAIQIARRSGVVGPIIGVCGKGSGFVEGLIDRGGNGDGIVDYRLGGEGVVKGIKELLGGRELRWAFDAVSDHGSYHHLGEVLSKSATDGWGDGLEGGGKSAKGKTSRITLVLPGKKYEGIPEHVEETVTSVGQVHQEGDEQGWDFGYVWFRYLSRGLKEGWFKPHPHEVVPGGLGGVQTALDNLKAGKASGVKYVMRIADTEGLAKL